jgi:hypothetical protein
MTPLGLDMLSRLPEVFTDDPDMRAVIHCYAKEADRLREFAEQVRAQFFPATATEVGLPLWELSLNLTVAPDGKTVDDRRLIVLAYLRGIGASGTGADFEDTLDLLVPGWAYDEHDPGDPTLPVPIYTLRVLFPYGAGSSDFRRAEDLLRLIIPANLDLIVSSVAGGLLDDMQLDEDVLG